MVDVFELGQCSSPFCLPTFFFNFLCLGFMVALVRGSWEVNRVFFFLLFLFWWMLLRALRWRFRLRRSGAASIIIIIRLHLFTINELISILGYERSPVLTQSYDVWNSSHLHLVDLKEARFIPWPWDRQSVDFRPRYRPIDSDASLQLIMHSAYNYIPYFACFQLHLVISPSYHQWFELHFIYLDCLVAPCDRYIATAVVCQGRNAGAHSHC